MLSADDTVYSGVPPSKKPRRLHSPSRLIREALLGLGLRAKLRRKPSMVRYTLHTSTVHDLPHNQSTDLIQSRTLHPLWEPSMSVATHIPIKLSKSEVSIALAFRYTRMLLHRPAGFGKTTFLQELGQFCDAGHNLNDSDKSFKYFSPENIKNPYVAIHRANYLILHFDLGNLLPAVPDTSDTFTEAGFRDRLMSEIRGSLDKYIIKYSKKRLLGSLSVDDPSEISLTHICHYLPTHKHITIITVDNYDAPFLNAPPGKLAIVERVIEELLYDNVLSVFGGYGLNQTKLIVMGRGIRDYHAPAKNIAHCLSLVDCTRFLCFADMVGLTVAEIKGAIQELVEDEAMRIALFKEIEDTCWRESFMGESSDMMKEIEDTCWQECFEKDISDVTTIVCPREVTEYLAGHRTKFGTSQTS